MARAVLGHAVMVAMTAPCRLLSVLLVPLVACLASVVPAIAAPITVDGSLADWGISVADGNRSNYSGLIGAGSGLLGSHVEDTSDWAGDAGYVGPNYGGQNYDAEFLGVAYSGSTVYIGIVTGQRPDNGLQRFAPGDIYIRTQSGVFGIEVGGGAGGGPGGAIGEGAAGSFYTLNSDGYTTAHTSLPARVAGSIWRDPTWYMDPLDTPSPTQMVAANSGSYVGLADFVYTRNSVTMQHAIIELSFDAALLGGLSALTDSEWRAVCGNDELMVDISVPEPATLLLFGGSVLAVAAIGRRRRRDPR
jgi:hypothetical protein